MPKRNRLTNNSDETEIATLISGDSVFSIPYFQRPYKWKPERLKRLERDILRLVGDESDIHFLGAIIIHGRRSNPSEPDVYDIIDGQQRITTLFLYLCAIVKKLSDVGEVKEAAGLFLKYLVISRETSLSSNLKLHSCKDDRAQINAVYLDLVSHEKLKQQLGSFKIKPLPLPATSASKGTLLNNYKAALRFLQNQFEQQGVERIRSIYRAILV